MISNKNKRTIGIVLLVIGLLFLPFTFSSIMSLTLLPIPVILLPLGFTGLYRGLSLQNRGILLIIVGGVFISITLYLIYRYRYRFFQESLMVTFIADISFGTLLFIIPGIAKYKQKSGDFKGTKFVFWDGVGIITSLTILIFTLITSFIAFSLFYTFFWYVFGGGFIAGLIIMAIAVYTDVIFTW